MRSYTLREHGIGDGRVAKTSAGASHRAHAQLAERVRSRRGPAELRDAGGKAGGRGPDLVLEAGQGREVAPVALAVEADASQRAQWSVLLAQTRAPAA